MQGTFFAGDLQRPHGSGAFHRNAAGQQYSGIRKRGGQGAGRLYVRCPRKPEGFPHNRPAEGRWGFSLVFPQGLADLDARGDSGDAIALPYAFRAHRIFRSAGLHCHCLGLYVPFRYMPEHCFSCRPDCGAGNDSGRLHHHYGRLYGQTRQGNVKSGCSLCQCSGAVYAYAYGYGCNQCDVLPYDRHNHRLSR